MGKIIISRLGYDCMIFRHYVIKLATSKEPKVYVCVCYRYVNKCKHTWWVIRKVSATYVLNKCNLRPK